MLRTASAASVTEAAEVAADQAAKDAAESSEKVPFLSLFQFADSTDYWLMAVGAVCAAIAGVTMPISFVFLGNAFTGLTSVCP